MAVCSIAVIINPISGTGGRADEARARAAKAASVVASHGGDPSLVFVTERSGHARELAASAIAQGASTVVAWGGDGTINEVGTAAAFTRASIAIVPSGSGNGLARELGIPFNYQAALDIACVGRERVIDAGDIAGRLFFNVAGVGLDARVAHHFAVGGRSRRGFARYIESTVRLLMSYVPDQLTITTDSSSRTAPVMLVAIANGRQYGNGARIAPKARLDDGLLDVVVVAHRSRLRALTEIPLVFLGRTDMVRGVTTESTTSVGITSTRPVWYHVDGEPIAGVSSIAAAVRPRALRVKVPERA